jgi:DNA-binding NarL/FixJ family response regulator
VFVHKGLTRPGKVPESDAAEQGAAGKRPVRVLIVDDHKAILWAIRMLIEGQRPRLEVAGTATDRAGALEAVRASCPEIILLDLDLGDENGLDLLPELLGLCGEQTRVIVLTGSRDTGLHDTAVRLGARGVILKEEPVEDILKAIDKVLRGELWLDRATAARILAEFSGRGREHQADPEAERAATLTPREREVVALVGEGLKNEQIAERLYVSEKTVRNNLTVIYDKLGVSNRLALILLAQRCGLAEAPGRKPAD